MEDIEDWVTERWGGFNYLLIGRNEDFAISYEGGHLWIRYNKRGMVGRVPFIESPTKYDIIRVEGYFGISDSQRSLEHVRQALSDIVGRGAIEPWLEAFNPELGCSPIDLLGTKREHELIRLIHTLESGEPS